MMSAVSAVGLLESSGTNPLGDDDEEHFLQYICPQLCQQQLAEPSMTYHEQQLLRREENKIIIMAMITIICL